MAEKKPVLSLGDIPALRSDNAVLAAQLRGAKVLARIVAEREEECALLRRQLTLMIDKLYSTESELEALQVSLLDGTSDPILEPARIASHLITSEISISSDSAKSDDGNVSLSPTQRLDQSPEQTEDDSCRSNSISACIPKQTIVSDGEDRGCYLCRHHNQFPDTANSAQCVTDTGDSQADSSRNFNDLAFAEKAAKTWMTLCEELSKELKSHQQRVAELESSLQKQVQSQEDFQTLKTALSMATQRLKAAVTENDQLQRMNASWQEYQTKQSETTSELEKNIGALKFEKTTLQDRLNAETRRVAELAEMGEWLQNDLVQERQNRDCIQNQYDDLLASYKSLQNDYNGKKKKQQAMSHPQAGKEKHRSETSDVHSSSGENHTRSTLWQSSRYDSGPGSSFTDISGLRSALPDSSGYAARDPTLLPRGLVARNGVPQPAGLVSLDDNKDFWDTPYVSVETNALTSASQADAELVTATAREEQPAAMPGGQSLSSIPPPQATQATTTTHHRHVASTAGVASSTSRMHPVQSPSTVKMKRCRRCERYIPTEAFPAHVTQCDG